MSHIDSFRHEIVGLFGGLPVYHPLEPIDGDFSCNPSQLLIGGGSGEHPALVILNPAATVARFLDKELESWKSSELKQAWQEILQEYIHWDYDEHFRFSQWCVETYRNFHEICCSAAMPNPLDGDMNLEEWLVLGIGEFVFFALPDLAAALIDRLDEPYSHFHHVRYNNIMLIPPNMPVYANGGNAFTFGRRNRGMEGRDGSEGAEK